MRIRGEDLADEFWIAKQHHMLPALTTGFAPGAVQNR